MLRSLEEIAGQIRQSPKLIIADDYELCIQRTRAASGRFKGGREISRSTDDSWWLGLRLMHRKRPGRSAVLFSGPDSLAVLIETAFESARLSSPDPWFRFPLWKQPKVKPPEEGETPEPESNPSLFSDVESLCEAAQLEFEEVHERWAIETLLQQETAG